jgi:hypothetical protein
MEIGSELASLLKKYGALLPDTKRDAVVGRLRKEATDFLEAVERGSKDVSRSMALRVLYVLAQANYGIPALPDKQDLSVVTLKKYEKLFAGDDDRDKLVDVLLWQTTFGGDEEPLARAEKLSQQVTSTELRDRAEGRCLRARADYRVMLIEKAIAAYKAAQTAGRAATKPTVNLKEVVEGYAEAEKRLARAAGADVTANLEKVRREPLAHLPARFERSLSNLEAHRLRSFLTETSLMRRDAITAVQGWMNLADVQKELADAKRNAKFPVAAEPLARFLHDMLKPRALLRDGNLTPDERLLLEIVEHKLAL